jgi:hypothetical protein
VKARIAAASERDPNKETAEQVEKATGSAPVEGEELLESEELKRKLADAKKRAKDFVRQHHSLGTTPAVAAGLEENRGA